MLIYGILSRMNYKLLHRRETALQGALYTVSGKKGATLFLPVTLRNVNRFSKFFYHHTLQ